MSISVNARLVIVLSLVLTTATFFTTYAVSLSLELTEYPWLFLSSTINHAPASNIGTLGLVFGSICVPIIGIVRFLQVFNVAPRSRANYGGLVLSFVVSFNVIGVASFQVSDTFLPHMIFAVGTFVSIVASVLVYIYLDHKHPETSSKFPKMYRKCVGVFISICFLTMVIIWLVKMNGVVDTQDGWIAATACAEVLLVGSGLTVFTSFWQDFSGIRLHFSIDNQNTLINKPQEL